MNWDRIVSVVSLVIATVALLVALGVGRPNPFGKPLDEYDLSNPQAALLSIQDMVETENLRAGISYFIGLLAIDDKDGKFSFFSDDVTDIKFVKSFEIKDSGYERNNGRVVSFVQYKIKGIEYRQVFYFTQSKGKFYPANDYSYPYSEDSRTESDKRYNAMIEQFKATGKVN
jgi:hypothetical protein